VMEALKMANSILAGVDGTVEQIYLGDGDDIETGDVVMEIA
jgi:biotin carboxyl carrier protein